MRRTQTRTTIYFLLTVIASVLFINLNQTAGMQQAKGIVQAILLPAAEAINALTGGIGHLASTLGEIGQVQQENRRLRDRVDQLETEAARLAALKDENAALRGALRFQEATHARVAVANVVAREPEGLARTVTLDVGSRDGVKANMVAVTGRGLVGKVVEVGLRTSKVTLAVDTSSRVNALLPASGAAGTVEGTGTGMQIKITTPPAGLSVKPPEPILTSGLGGNYPARLVIGSVVSFQRRDQLIEQLAVVQPAVDFAHLRIAMVMLDFVPAL